MCLVILIRKCRDLHHSLPSLQNILQSLESGTKRDNEQQEGGAVAGIYWKHQRQLQESCALELHPQRADGGGEMPENM